MPPKKIRCEFFVEARYPFQVWGLEFPLPGGQITRETLPQIVEDFERLHEERYGAREPGQYVEFTHWRVSTSGLMPRLTHNEKRSSAEEDASKALKGKRKAYFKEKGAFLDAWIYDGGFLAPGREIAGPAIVEEPGTTLVIPPKWKAFVTHRGDYLLRSNGNPSHA
jgi:N-methylhydantoinase A